MDMKLISATGHLLVSRPLWLYMVIINMATGNGDNHSLWKDVLRDIYHSEDLKIKGERSEQIKNTIHSLCTEVEGDDLDSFVVSFKKIEDNIRVIKDACKKKEQTLFQQMFQYQANSLSLIIQHLPTSLKDPILWQVSECRIQDGAFGVNSFPPTTRILQ